MPHAVPAVSRLIATRLQCSWNAPLSGLFDTEPLKECQMNVADNYQRPLNHLSLISSLSFFPLRPSPIPRWPFHSIWERTGAVVSLRLNGAAPTETSVYAQTRRRRRTTGLRKRMLRVDCRIANDEAVVYRTRRVRGPSGMSE